MLQDHLLHCRMGLTADIPKRRNLLQDRDESLGKRG